MALTKDELFAYVDDQRDDLVAMADHIFDNPEYDGKEYEASALISGELERHGFTVERGVGGFETAFRAVYTVGEGGPSIGLLCEYDALIGLGHGCGHHMQGPAILGAAFAVQRALTDAAQPYKLVVYGTPAEETQG